MVFRRCERDEVGSKPSAEHRINGAGVMVMGTGTHCKEQTKLVQADLISTPQLPVLQQLIAEPLHHLWIPGSNVECLLHSSIVIWSLKNWPACLKGITTLLNLNN
jgi:hypothetical protein